jgi:hypothetical protein
LRLKSNISAVNLNTVRDKQELQNDRKLFKYYNILKYTFFIWMLDKHSENFSAIFFFLILFKDFLSLLRLLDLI